MQNHQIALIVGFVSGGWSLRAWMLAASARDGFSWASRTTEPSSPGAESLAQRWHGIDAGYEI